MDPLADLAQIAASLMCFDGHPSNHPLCIKSPAEQRPLFEIIW